MKLALAVLPNGRINPHFGRAKKVAVATVENGRIVAWEEVEAAFAEHHPGSHHEHGAHHHDVQTAQGEGRVRSGEWSKHQTAIKDFLVQHGVDVLILEHAGPGIARVLEETDIRVVTGARGDAREAVGHVVRFLEDQKAQGR